MTETKGQTLIQSMEGDQESRVSRSLCKLESLSV